MSKMGCFLYSSKNSNESKRTKGKGRSGSVAEIKKPNNYYSSKWHFGSNPSDQKKVPEKNNIYNRNSSLKNQQKEKQVNPLQNQNTTSNRSQQSKQVVASQSNYNPSSRPQQQNFVDPYQNANNQNFNGQYNQMNSFQNQNIPSNNNVFLHLKKRNY